jgi:hypothetical protein
MVKRPVGEVFDAVAAAFFEIGPKWNPRIEMMEKTSSGAMGVGTTGRALATNRYGQVVDQRYEITEYEPGSRVAYIGMARFADQQPDGVAPPRDLTSMTPFRARVDFAGIDGGTLLTIDTQSDLKISLYYKLTWPLWTSVIKEEDRRNAYRLRDYLEQAAGLPVRPAPRPVRRAWLGWGLYIVVFLLLFWAHSARLDLGLSVDLVNVLRAVMSGMVVLAFVAVLVIGIIQNSVHTRDATRQKSQNKPEG